MFAFLISWRVDTLCSESNKPSGRLVIPVAWNSSVVKEDRFVKDDGKEPADRSLRQHSPTGRLQTRTWIFVVSHNLEVL